MADIVKKATAPKKPRTTSTKKTAATNRTEIHAVSGNSALNGNSGLNGTAKASHDDIARLAHRFWAERGQQHGHDAEDWLRAERELRGKAS